MPERDYGSLPDIDSAVIDENTELVKSIDYTRPLTDYATSHDIADFIKRRRRIYDRVALNSINGARIVQDDMAVYLRNPAYSSSILKESLKSPLHLFYAKESDWKIRLEKLQKEKECFSLGTVIHSCILEPDKFNSFVFEPDAYRTTTEGIDKLIKFWEAHIAEHGGRIDGKKVNSWAAVKDTMDFVKSAGRSLDKIDGKRLYYDRLKEISGKTVVTEAQKIMIDAIRYNFERYGGGVLLELMKGAKTEVSIYHSDPATGLSIRIRPDAIQFSENIGHNAIISVKTTSCESLSHFYYQTAKYMYELSEGMYLEVAEAATGRPFTATIMIVVQTVPPFAVAALVWNGEDLEIGKYKYHQSLLTVCDCIESGKYPGFDAYAEQGNMGFIDMKQPTWNAKELFPTDIDV